jgi:hypothetical protein
LISGTRRSAFIDRSKTKNGTPHAIPVPPLAAELIEVIVPNDYGWFFPSATDPTRPVSHGTLYGSYGVNGNAM